MPTKTEVSKIEKHLFARRWTNKDGTVSEELLMKFEVKGRAVNRRVICPDTGRLPKSIPEARRFKNAWMRECEKPSVKEVAEARVLTFREYVYLKDGYLDTLKSRPIQAGSKEDAAYQLGVLCVVFGDKPLGEIAETDVQRFKVQQLETKQPKTVKHYLDRLRAVFNFALEQGDITAKDYKFRRVTDPPESERRYVRFPVKWENAVYEQCDQCDEAWREKRLPLKLATIVMLDMGMRKDEYLRIEMQDVCLSSGTVTVYWYKHGRRQSGAARKRVVPITTKRCHDAIAQLMKGRERAQYLHPYRSVKKAWLSVTAAAAQAIGEPALAEYWFRDLRSESITRMFERNLTELEVFAVTGHLKGQGDGEAGSGYERGVMRAVGHSDLRMSALYTKFDAARIVDKLDGASAEETVATAVQKKKLVIVG